MDNKIVEKAKLYDEAIKELKINDKQHSMEYSKNPIIEYCLQIQDFRWCERKEFELQVKDLKLQIKKLNNKIKRIQTYIQKIGEE